MDNDPLAPIAITGIGLVTPLGADAESTWARVKNGECGVRPMSVMESTLPPGSDGGQAVDLLDDYSPSLPREARYLKFAIAQALRSAGVDSRLPCDPSRASYMLGTTLHGMRAAGRFLRSNDHAELRSFLAGDTLRLATSDFALRGGSATTCSACSSSLGSIALGITMLQSGAVDLVVAGGYDPISEYAWAGFNALRLVSGPPLRPFTRGRSGMKLAEAYAVVVLERLDDAYRRNAKIIAHIRGWGESADAHHLTQPHPEGKGALAAMRQAVERAEITPSDLGLIAAHATGTPDNDASERAAIAQLLAAAESKSSVVGLKSHMGHTLGGAGACELILSALAIRDQVVPACANVKPDEVEFNDINLSTGKSKPGAIENTLNTSLGFGGANTCIVLGKKPRKSSESSPEIDDVVITGVGVLMPDVIDLQSLKLRLSETPMAWAERSHSIESEVVEQLLNARRVRRMSHYVKLSLASAMLAMRDASLESTTDLAAILGTMHGSAAYSREYYGQIVREGVAAANPMLFAEGVPNAAAAQLSLMLGLKFACQTIIGTRTAGLDALRLAMLRIATGQWTRAIVGAAEETEPTVMDAYRHCGLHASANSENGFISVSSSASFIVESAQSAAARGARVYAKFTGSQAACGAVSDIANTVSRVALPSKLIIGSSNQTWVDRAEAIATHGANYTSYYPQFGELFSATPLMALAAQLVQSTAGDFTILCTDFGGSATSIRAEVTA